MAARRRTITLGSEPGIRDIQPLFEKLSENLAHDAPIVIDASTVQRCDGAVLQLLVAFVRAREGQQRSVEFRQPSSVFADLVHMSDMASALGTRWSGRTSE